jgi:hypothetical protein
VIKGGGFKQLAVRLMKFITGVHSALKCVYAHGCVRDESLVQQKELIAS